MMASPLLSVITVAYNASSVLPPTLRSLENQTDKDFEYVFIDGNSADSTLSQAKAADITNKVIVSENDGGIYDAMNKGFEKATGQYIVFLNAGDSFADNDVVHRIKEAIVSSNPDVVYGQTDIVDNKGNYVGPRHLSAPEALTFRSFRNGMLVCHQAFIAKKSIAEKYDLGYRFSADYDWCLKILKKMKTSAYLGARPLVHYLKEGATTRNHRASLKERFIIMSKNYGWIPTVLLHFKFFFRNLRIK